jgi:hypothetical protein
VNEICDDLDQNCNGLRDEQSDGGPLRQPCYTGTTITRNVGRCRDGSQSCVSGAYGTCSGDILPGTETCNGIDDNCNAATDEQADGGPLTQTCYTGPAGTSGIGRCRTGTQNCTGGSFSGACNGQVIPTGEVCSNSIDDDCDNLVDEACDGGNCDPNGVFTIDGGQSLVYSCCGGAVNFNINRFVIQNSASQVSPQPQHSGGTLPVFNSQVATCPSGNFSYRRVLNGTCTETYTLTGTFVGPDTFVGTYTAAFTGSGCSDFTCQFFGGRWCT